MNIHEHMTKLQEALEDIDEPIVISMSNKEHGGIISSKGFNALTPLEKQETLMALIRQLSSAYSKK